MLQERRDDDEEKFGSAGSEATELVENLCAMHLGSNLRKAFLDGIKLLSKDNEVNPSDRREFNPVETFIYEFCKLLGTNGVPENGCG